VDAGIILGIVLVSGLLSFWQERGANDAVEKLLAIVQVKATVLRDGKSVDIPVEEVVPGDIVLLTAGDVIPGDCLILESNELFADEATLTGETYPVEKQPGILPADTPLAKRSNSLFMGTHVVSGSATAAVVHTAKDTPKAEIVDTLQGLKQLGVSVKMITGDNPLVAASVGEQVGLSGAEIVTAKDLQLSDEALRARVNDVDIFAEIEPNQRLRIAVHGNEPSGMYPSPVQ
jgi:magnesium-transporting ATPase (P-type)